ncbi:MAG: hypothetical protein ACM3NH_04410 [Candidatus Saccharibacteria bacterium]
MGSKSILQSSPATFDRERFCDLFKNGQAHGMVVSFSEYTYSFDSKVIHEVRRMTDELDRPVAILLAVRGLPETDKDFLDLQFGIRAGIDFVLLPIVKSAKEISLMKQEIRKFGKDLPVIAQVDNARASAELTAVMKSADACFLDPRDVVVPADLPKDPDADIVEDVKKKTADPDLYRGRIWIRNNSGKRSAAISQTLLHLAGQVDADAIAVGDFEHALALSALRTDKKVIFSSRDRMMLNRASLLWGVTPINPKADLAGILKAKGLVSPGRRYINATQKSAGSIESMA